jgi:hypothetical protein
MTMTTTSTASTTSATTKNLGVLCLWWPERCELVSYVAGPVVALGSPPLHMVWPGAWEPYHEGCECGWCDSATVRCGLGASGSPRARAPTLFRGKEARLFGLTRADSVVYPDAVSGLGWVQDGNG